MAIKELTLASLLELDGGRVSEAFMAELRRVVSDCDDRPADGKERKVKLEFSVIPVLGETGHLEGIEGRFLIDSTIPKRRSKVLPFEFRHGGRLAFTTNDHDHDSQLHHTEE